MHINLIISGNINSLTGGYIYDKKLIEEFRRLSHQISVHSVTPKNTERIKQIFSQFISNEIVIIDSLVFGLIPEILEQYYHSLTLVAMMHLPLSYNLEENDELFLSEKKSLEFADLVIVTSSFSKNLLKKYDVNSSKLLVIEPGQETVKKKKNYKSIPQNLLCVANVTQQKGYTILIEALNRLKNYDWSLRCVGKISNNKEYFEFLSNKISNQGLEQRIVFTGEIQGEKLHKEYLNADLFVFPSEFETYGMALAEALNHNLPIVTTRAGAIPETVPEYAGKFFNVNNVNELVDILDILFTENGEYTKLCNQISRNGAFIFPTWKENTEELIKELEKLSL